MKNNKGITLIALVITIIVLLILAGVSIAMLTGENGLLTRANESKTETLKAEAVEKANMEAEALYATLLSGKEAEAATTVQDRLNNGASEGVTFTCAGDSTTGYTITIEKPTGLTTNKATVSKTGLALAVK